MKAIFSILKQKIKLFKNNPRIIKYWIYKLFNQLSTTTLNNGERYDPNILKKFGINDKHQSDRYVFAATLINPHDSVLDIACGTGYGTLILANRCKDITGVDISAKAISFANKHYHNQNLHFIESDLEHYHELADVVISFETIEHIPANIQSTVSKLLDLTRKKLICSVPYLEPKNNNKHHLHFNISEQNFNFLNQKFTTTYLYQTEDGAIYQKKRKNTLSLIVIVNKK